MIKGCQKKIIKVKDTGNKYFEEAYFIIKNECLGSDINQYSIIKDATDIVNDYITLVKPKRKRKRLYKHLLCFIAGLLLGVGLCSVLYFLFL